jgi:hypothetical protein
VAYRIRATDRASAERALDSGRVVIERGNGSLEIETPERRLSTGLAWLFGGARVSADILIEAPWGTKLRFETMSGSLEAENLVGDQKYRTVSGDIRMWNLGGHVEAGTISGGIALDGGSALRLRASTISGGIKARAGLFHGLSLSTTSGSMIVVGALDPAGDHRAESISGSVDFTPLSGLSAELKTVSGSIHSAFEGRIEGTRGFWRAIVGDGRANLRVNSTSGSLRLLAPRPSDTDVGTSGGAATTQPVAGTGRSEPAPAETEAAVPTGHAARPQPGAAAAAAATPTTEASASESPESWNPNETAEEAADHARDDQADDDQLAVLQALERGEIGVDEAAARLERTGR